MSITNSMQGNSQAAETSWAPAEIPKRTIWGRELVALGRRLSELLRAAKSSGGREDDPMYFGM
jgi:hypothetical protein